jgi:hypothetical protein
MYSFLQNNHFAFRAICFMLVSTSVIKQKVIKILMCGNHTVLHDSVAYQGIFFQGGGGGGKEINIFR